MSMFEEIVRQNPKNPNGRVNIAAEVRKTEQRIGANPVVMESIRVVAPFNGSIRKTELLDIWRKTDVSFAAKCLITLWWGHPNYNHTNDVYSTNTITLLSN